jgi:hypothetical protein
MNQNRTNNNPILSGFPYLVFFIVSFIYFGFFADYILFYQEKASLFIFSFDFFTESINRPGGFVIYLGKFFSAFFYYPAAGAFIVAITLTLIPLTLSRIILLFRGKSPKILPLIIGLAVFYLQTDYRFLFYFNLGILLQLVFAFLAIKYLKVLKGWIPVLLFPLWYLATGGFAWIALLMLTLSYVSDKGKKGFSKIITLWLLTLITIFISEEFLFFQSGKTLMLFPFPEIPSLAQLLLFCIVAALISFIPAISEIKIKLPVKAQLSELLTVILATGFVIIALGILIIIQYDRKTKEYFVVEKLFYQNKFDEVIAYNSEYRSTNSLTIFLNNIALCEKDRLNDMLFHFLQSPDGSTLFLKWEMYGEVLKRGGYFYYTIGMVNEAHRWAFENMVMKGYSPEGVKMLIKTNLINGNYNVAAKFISTLKKSLFYKNEAGTFEKLLFNDAAIDADEDLGEKRRNRLETDFFSITDDPYVNIERILANDTLNIKAFEYKVAFLLLAKDYQGISDVLPALESFGYTRIPIHVEEALMAVSLLNPDNPPEFGKLQISENTIQRWGQYLSAFQQYGNDLKRAEPALRRQFGNTFWYYAFYR